jgi:hypothetical protein
LKPYCAFGIDVAKVVRLPIELIWLAEVARLPMIESAQSEFWRIPLRVRRCFKNKKTPVSTTGVLLITNLHQTTRRNQVTATCSPLSALGAVASGSNSCR